VFFAAAGASDAYRTPAFLIAVVASRGVRYIAIAIIGDLYGRHVIRVLRHPTQYWGWLILLTAAFVALILAGIAINKRMAKPSA
jgi:hypothetical protein